MICARGRGVRRWGSTVGRWRPACAALQRGPAVPAAHLEVLQQLHGHQRDLGGELPWPAAWHRSAPAQQQACVHWAAVHAAPLQRCPWQGSAPPRSAAVRPRCPSCTPSAAVLGSRLHHQRPTPARRLRSGGLRRAGALPWATAVAASHVSAEPRAETQPRGHTAQNSRQRCPQRWARAGAAAAPPSLPAAAADLSPDSGPPGGAAARARAHRAAGCPGTARLLPRPAGRR